MGALEGAVESVGEEVGAGDGGCMLWRDGQVGRAPGAAPGEV